jgi:hypothetical protein
MQPSNNDRRQAFTDVVTLEAWHAAFGQGSPAVDLHVDVVFGTGRLGEEADSPIRFKLDIRRAEIVVVVPQMEPVVVDPASVSRDAPQLTGQLTSSTEKRSSRSLGAKIFGALSFRSPSGGASLSAEASGSVQTSEKIELAGTAEIISVTQSKSREGHYRWTVVPRTKEVLEGRPWDGSKKPRLKLIDSRGPGSASLSPSVRVEIRCRREDLAISDLTLKDESHWASVVGRSGFRNRLAAAESYIRDRLSSDGLHVGDLNELFARLTIASVSAHSVPESS